MTPTSGALMIGRLHNLPITLRPAFQIPIMPASLRFLGIAGAAAMNLCIGDLWLGGVSHHSYKEIALAADFDRVILELEKN